MGIIGVNINCIRLVVLLIIVFNCFCLNKNDFLIKAIDRNDINKVISLIKEGANPNATKTIKGDIKSYEIPILIVALSDKKYDIRFLTLIDISFPDVNIFCWKS